MIIQKVQIKCSECDTLFEVPWSEITKTLWVGPRKKVNDKWEHRLECEIYCPVCKATFITNINQF